MCTKSYFWAMTHDMHPSIFRQMICILFLSSMIAMTSLHGQKIDGITIVAPPKPYESEPFTRVMETGNGWVCFVPYGFTRQGNTSVHFNNERQWWGEKTEGVAESIRLAQEKGLSVMLKPQVYFPGSWPGDMSFDNNEDWEAWEAEYRTYILHWAELAEEYHIELLCIGTEFKQSVKQRGKYWKSLIKEIRSVYCGELTYSANWDEYPDVSFWNDLDYIGVSAYFPQLESDTPDVDDLVESWMSVRDGLEKFSSKVGRPVLFTEFGFLAVDGCAGKTWLLEKKVRTMSINETCQANAFDAIFTAFGDQAWWAGGFIWKWFPHGRGHEGYPKRDYTPQDKEAEAVVTRYFSTW